MVVVWIVLAVVVAGLLASAVVVRGRRRAPRADAREAPIAPPASVPAAAAPAEPPPPPAVAEPPAAPSWDDRLGKTRGAFSSLRALRRQGDLDTTSLAEVRETLLGADVGVDTTDVVLAALR